MAEDNYGYVGSVLDAVRDGLAPYVLTRYKQRHEAEHYLKILRDTLEGNSPKRRLQFDSEGEALLEIDAAGWLNAIVLYHAPFSKELGRKIRGNDENAKNAINLASELLLARNRWAHRKRRNVYTDEDVYRVADSAFRLLRAVKADANAAIIEEVKRKFGEKLYAPEEIPSETVDPEPQSTPTAEPTVQIVREPALRVDLSGAKLREMDLRNRRLRFAVLNGADLEASNLREEDLTEAQLDNAELHSVDLSDAALVRASLREATLDGASLSHAVLHRAKLRSANLRHANMEFANLQYADLTKADMDSANLKDADLRYTNLTNTNLVGTDLRGAKLLGAILKGATLKWEGRDFFRKSPTKVVFDETTVLPDGSYWTEDTDMTNFTGPPT